MSDIVERLRDAARFLDELEDFPELQIRAAEEITGLREENAKLKEQQVEIERLREENARLREALKPFADVAKQVGDEDARWAVPSAYLRAAAAAILGKVKDEAACPEPDEAP